MPMVINHTAAYEQDKAGDLFFVSGTMFALPVQKTNVLIGDRELYKEHITNLFTKLSISESILLQWVMDDMKRLGTIRLACAHNCKGECIYQPLVDLINGHELLGG